MRHPVIHHRAQPASAHVLALAACLFAACGRDQAQGTPAQGNPAAPPSLPVDVETAVPRPVEESSEYVATLVSRRSVTLYPRVSGYVREILVRPGDEVRAGTRLIRIDARQEAAALTQAQAALAQAETQLQLAMSTRQRMEALQREGIRSRQDLENAAAEEAAARANVRAARANTQAQGVQLAYHDVTAPIAGVVGDIVVKVGDTVTPQTELTQVDEAGRLEISVGVPLDRANQARVGETPIEVLDESGKAQLRATVFFVAPRPDPRTQLVELRAAFANAGGLRSGQRVRARVVWRVFEALSVPTFAVTRQSGQAFLFVVRRSDKGPNKGAEVVERRPVKLGIIAGDRWTVTEGLHAGDRVAVTRLQALRDGQPVKVNRSDGEGSGVAPERATRAAATDGAAAAPQGGR